MPDAVSRWFLLKCLMACFAVLSSLTCAIGISQAAPSIADAQACQTFESLNQTIAGCTALLREKLTAPQQAGVLTNRGQAYYGQGRLAFSEQDFSKAIDIDGSLPQTWYNRCQIWSNYQDWKRAIEDCSKAISLAAEFVTPYLSRGAAYAALGDFGRAEADFSKAILLNPSDYRGYADRCWVRTGVGNYAQASTDCEFGLSIKEDDPVSLTGQGLLAYKQEKYDIALDRFGAALHVKPESSTALYGRGIAYSRKGDHEKAQADIIKALDLDSSVVSRFRDYNVSIP